MSFRFICFHSRITTLRTHQPLYAKYAFKVAVATLPGLEAVFAHGSLKFSKCPRAMYTSPVMMMANKAISFPKAKTMPNLVASFMRTVLTMAKVTETKITAFLFLTLCKSAQESGIV